MIEACTAVSNGALTCRRSASPGLIIASHQKFGRRSRLKVDFARKRFRSAQPGLRAGLVRACRLLLLGASISIGFSETAQSADVGDDTAKAAASTLPNIYLDMRTMYTKTPGDTLSLGFSNPSSSAVATLQSLGHL
jgi:hypothetical protein